MEPAEIRLRLIEAAARNPDPRHTGGFAASVLETAQKWEQFVVKGGTLTVPTKKTP